MANGATLPPPIPSGGIPLILIIPAARVDALPAATTAAPAAPGVEPVATATLAAATTACPTANGAANIRSGPGTTFDVVGHAQAGQCLTVTGKNDAGDWYQLSDGNWIATFLVEGADSTTAVVSTDRAVSVPAVATDEPQPVAPTPVPPTPIPPTATPEPQAAAPEPLCDPNYAGACIPIVSGDLDCPDVGAVNFQVVGSDHHRFDRDHDGIACEQD